MTIRPGDAWGARVARPPGLVDVQSDADLVRIALAPGAPPARLRAGDLARTLGVEAARSPALDDTGDTVLEFPIDVLEVATGAAEFVACAHVVAKPPAGRGGWWLGPLVGVMNAEFRGDWDVVPRGHPNDGRAEVIEADASMTVRERLEAKRRLPLGGHLPHPRIHVRSVREVAFEFASPMALFVDGVKVGRTRSVVVRVRPDAVVVYA